MPLFVVRNDITRMQVDAIVNAANSSLLGGGGVDGAIHAAAGPGLLAECRTLGGCATGQAKVTDAYRLPCRRIVHTVGPIWYDGKSGEADALASCYRSCLAIAERENYESIAFPLISAGAYGYPKHEAFALAVREIENWLEDHPEVRVFLVLFTRSDVLVGRSRYEEIREYINDRYIPENYAAAEEKRSLLLGKFSASRADAFPNAARARGKSKKAPKPIEPEAVEEIAEFSACASVDEDFISPAELEKVLDESFSEMLLRKIDESGMTDVECYKRAGIDRKLFSKIRSDRAYRPSKQTVILFALALHLPLNETAELLMKAGFALSRSYKFDIIIEFCIVRGIYEIALVNQMLYSLDQPLLGC